MKKEEEKKEGKEEEKERKEEEKEKERKEEEKKENNCLFLNCRSIVIEPFCDGSHQQFINQLIKDIPECSSFTLAGKKWHWKARTSAIYFSQVIPKNKGQYCKTLFASSVLNLAELVALRPDLASLHKILYFHENQLVYPVRKQQERDFQYGYNQIVSSLVADTLVFNSQYNKNSFLENIPTFLKLIPDHRPRNIPEKLSPKCRVIYFPLSLPPGLAALSVVAENVCGSLRPLDSNSSNAPGLAALSVVAENVCGSLRPLDSNSSNAPGLAALSVVAENVCGSLRPLDSNSSNAPGLAALSVVAENECGSVRPLDSNSSNAPGLAALSVVAENECGSVRPLDSNSSNAPGLAALSVVAENECGSVRPLDSNSSNAPDLAALSVVAENECGSVRPLDSNSSNAPGLAALSVVAENECGLTQKQALDKDGRFVCGGYKSSQLNKNPETTDGVLRKKKEEEEERCSNIESHFVQKTIKSKTEPLHIVWPHRWEHDKDPETLFDVLMRLHEEKIDFFISIIGQRFTDVPNVFAKFQSKLSPHIKTWGFVESKSKYYDILRAADVVVSTAKHEFFGVAMLEAVYFGCYPLCPNRLVYPEFFPGRYLYNTPNQLYKRLKEFCRRPFLSRNHQPQVNLEQFSWKHLRPFYYDILNRN